MAEGFLKSFDSNIEVYSAGINPSSKDHPKVVKVMKEMNIDILQYCPTNVNKFINKSFYFVITVCDNARQTCSVFMGIVEERIHVGFKDPAEAIGEENEILNVYRNVRDEIKSELYNFYIENIKTESI